jgi:hypothetical protein
MSHRAHSLRARAAVAAGALTLALSLVGGPVALAQDDGPDATVRNLLAAISAKDFAALPTYFCDEYAAQAAGFDLSALAGQLPEGTDPQALLDAFQITTDLQSADVVSQTADEAVVKLVATLSMSVDAEKLAPFVASMIASTTGLEGSPDPAMIEGMTAMIASSLADATDTTIDEEITLVPGEAMPWVICDQLGGDASPAASLAPGEAPAAEASPAG